MSLAAEEEEAIEYEYEMDEPSGARVVLGRGSFGTVYSAIDVLTKKKMAVKEIAESSDASGYAVGSTDTCTCTSLVCWQ